MRIILTLFLFTALSAQSQTNQEIYNYITKGYVTTLSQGLDFKKGYAYTELYKGAEFTGTVSGAKYQFSYRNFYKEGAANNTLAYMVVLTKNGLVERVYCMPSYGSHNGFWDLFWKDINSTLYADQKQQLSADLAYFLTILVRGVEQSKK